MHLMKKTIALLVLTTAITGCQSSKPGSMDEESLTALRCWHFRDQNPITKEHVAYVRKQSKRGNLACKTILGHMYERGLGMPVDIPKAKAIYQALADADESAYLELGRLAEEGIGEPVDYVKAREFYERAAKKGNNTAATKLAVLMEQGKGGPRDLDGALIIYIASPHPYKADILNSIQRLRTQGLKLNTEEKEKYNGSWVKNFSSTLSSHIRYAQAKLSRDIKTGSSLNRATLQLKFTANSDTPEISIIESSGDAAIDQRILDSMSGYRLRSHPILPESQKTWTINQYFNLKK
ncbi:hypothetical protein SAMN05216575_101529 [Ectopseudomonas alcaliphila]|uniref:Sel1 repeat-containing protein n=2 Tax=Ectopseudomonas alcaliphila TaxID=101564 RepID=A0A1G6UNU4_9GAMM|nr:hypothetical protein SAMN05216575_101529 [Pseudomonas alcaliphila]